MGWDCPPQGWYKFNTDRAMKVGCQAAVARGILRNDQKEWIVGFTINLGSYSALVAKVWGVWHAWQIAWARGCRKVILELDSMMTIQLINNGTKSINTANRLAKDIKKMLELDWEVHMQHVLHEGNRVANALANIDILLPLDLHKFEVAP